MGLLFLITHCRILYMLYLIEFLQHAQHNTSYILYTGRKTSSEFLLSGTVEVHGKVKSSFSTCKIYFFSFCHSSRLTSFSRKDITHNR
jgi:hypothetical protein